MSEIPKTKWQLKAWCWLAAKSTMYDSQLIWEAKNGKTDEGLATDDDYNKEIEKRAKQLYEWVKGG